MLTRLRIEGEGPDPETIRRDLYAVLHLIIATPGVGDPVPHYEQFDADEHYEKLPFTQQTAGDIGEPRVYKGRVAMSFPVNAEHSLHASADGKNIERGWVVPQAISISLSTSDGVETGGSSTPPPVAR